MNKLLNQQIDERFDELCVNIINYFSNQNILEINSKNHISFSKSPKDNQLKKKKIVYINYSTNFNRYGYY